MSDLRKIVREVVSKHLAGIVPESDKSELVCDISFEVADKINQSGVILLAIFDAYEIGASCVKEVNSGRKWTKAKLLREKLRLRKIAKTLGYDLTDDDYERMFNN